MDRAEDFIEEMRRSKIAHWVADQIEETLIQGISMNAKEAIDDARFFQLRPSYEITTRERNKRQNYETTRPFSDDEKIDLIISAIESIYLELPKIRKSALDNIRELGIPIEKICFFSSEDESVNQYETLDIDFEKIEEEADIAEHSFESFTREIKDDKH
ncbi:hypothetical protein ACQKEF_12085 [Pseudomonas oryzihabitans]|uniref:hypothetical protein n=1 Tax=Pseudomonas oryzihabitans TaxID=47885 RepID=UPI003CFBFF82